MTHGRRHGREGRKRGKNSNGHPGGWPSNTRREADVTPAWVCAWRAAYQRDRLSAGRDSRGFASLTVSARPASIVPWSFAMAVLAAVLSGISTNPKPLERPVSRSVMILTFLPRHTAQRAGGGHGPWRYTPDWQHKYSRSVPFWEWVHTIARSSEQYAGVQNARALCRKNGEESLEDTQYLV